MNITMKLAQYKQKSRKIGFFLKGMLCIKLFDKQSV